MQIRTGMVACAIAALLSGCATTRFSTPPVNLATQVAPAGDDRCNLQIGTESANNPEDLRSAFRLIDNYAASYSCALAQTSDGRQWFQIPSHLAAVAGIAGAAFGGPADLALAAGIASATFNSANSYWAPQEKAVVIDAALDAILCIKLEAVGLPFIDTTKPAALEASRSDGTLVGVSAERRYYTLVSGSLQQVDRIAGSRLRGTGRFDPAGVVAEIEALSKKINEEEQKRVAGQSGGQPTKPAELAVLVPPAVVADDGEGPNRPAVPSGNSGATVVSATPAGGHFLINVDLLQPKMQRCVVRAKL